MVVVVVVGAPPRPSVRLRAAGRALWSGCAPPSGGALTPQQAGHPAPCGAPGWHSHDPPPPPCNTGLASRLTASASLPACAGPKPRPAWWPAPRHWAWTSPPDASRPGAQPASCLQHLGTCCGVIRACATPLCPLRLLACCAPAPGAVPANAPLGLMQTQHPHGFACH